MKVIITKNYEEMSEKAYEIVRDVIKANPNAVLGLATGSSPIGLYDDLVKAYERGEISFKNIRTVNLDEYVGLDYSSDQSYVYFMRKNLFERVDIDLANTNLPDGKAKDLEAECARYTKLVEGMQQDVQVLGLGSNGHIAFNEPGTPFDSTTHVVKLTESTIKDNSRLFKNIDEVPRSALTMGIANIMNAKKIVVVANGANKADAIYKTVKGEITEAVPASILQKHPDVTIVCDELAAAKL
ncbi:MAG TPA: glucosamine-6-phosphate deaminase [Candidatus Borkfalkia excrementavium]|uniref:Glucosamine-6-phosphate deaminase n=1 Tax=Candidatus Borkfalkia excrementavium TaxID=2838505 RepID=A0A9D2CGL3_9FIRM|nr:glucosamine-6-phosphate deaminase [Candidatus Borkfalkia excrementavium]